MLVSRGVGFAVVRLGGLGRRRGRRPQREFALGFLCPPFGVAARTGQLVDAFLGRLLGLGRGLFGLAFVLLGLGGCIVAGGVVFDLGFEVGLFAIGLVEGHSGGFGGGHVGRVGWFGHMRFREAPWRGLRGGATPLRETLSPWAWRPVWAAP
jgi:hypothetical protein